MTGFTPITRTEKQLGDYIYIPVPGSYERVAVKVGSGEVWNDPEFCRGYEKWTDAQEQAQ